MNKKSTKKIIYLATALLAAICLASCTTNTQEQNNSQRSQAETKGQQDFSHFTDQVSQLVTLNWPQMNKVWPTYNYKDHNFILFYLDDQGQVKEAKLLNSQGIRNLKAKEYEKITPPNPEGYDQLEFEGNPSIAMSVDDTSMSSADAVNELYKTATHEMVHFYYQDGIETSADSSRSQTYPIEVTPRLYRQMLYHRLIQALEEPDKEAEYLGKAKFWLDKYNTEFKNEADSIRATDIAEATARYTENFGMFIGQNLSAQEQRTEAAKAIPKDQIFLAADKESYEIGYVAALILDQKEANWKEHYYATGKGIPEVLLETVSPTTDEADTKLKDKITETIQNSNQESQEKLKDIITSKDDMSIPYLHLDVSKGSKSFYAENIFRYQNLSVMAGYSNTFTVDGKTIDLQSTAIISGYETENQYIRIPLTMKYTIKDGKLTIDSDTLKAEGIPVQTSKEGDRTIYSAVVGD